MDRVEVEQLDRIEEALTRRMIEVFAPGHPRADPGHDQLRDVH